jgi:leader peptidase (prepilin peptidase)/N-methyltransferase
MGLITAMVGAVFGALLMRLIRWVFGWALGKEAMGLGDADLMMMIGAFLGWQATIVVLPLAVVGGLVYVLALIVVNPRFLFGERAFAFGPFLALGAVVTLLFFYRLVQLAWYLFQIPYQSMIFDGPMIVLAIVLIFVTGLLTTLVIRMIRLIVAAD